MGQPNEAPKPFESGYKGDLVRRHGLELKVSPEFLAKRQQIQSFLSGSKVEEHKLKLKEGDTLLGLRVDAANVDQEYDQALDDETCCFNKEEKKAYCDTIDQCVGEKETSSEDKEAFRRTIFERILQPKDYLSKYKHWRQRWEKDAGVQNKYPDFEEYALERGKDFVRSRLKDMRESRLKDFQQKSMPQAGTEEQKDAQLKDIFEKAGKFMRAHQEELLECETLDANDPRRQKLFQKFLSETGIKGAKIDEARKLFDDLIGDLAAAYVVMYKLELNNTGMVGMAQYAVDHGEDIQEENWNMMIQNNLQKDQYFKEAMQQQQAVVYQPGGDADVNKGPLLSPQAVALEAGGLRIVGDVSYDPKTGTYSCMVRYPDSDYEVKMKIGKIPGSNTFDNASFTFEDPYADKAKGKTVTLSRKNLRSGCNQMFLDYLMNEKIKRINPSPDFSPNDILHDAMLLSMAERFFNLNFNNIVLTPDMRSTFTRFLQVLMRDDDTNTAYGNLGSFEARVKKMDTVLAKPQYAKRLLDEFKEHQKGFASVIPPPISKLLEKIGYKE